VIDFTTLKLGRSALADFTFIVRTQFHELTNRDLRSSSDEELMRSLRAGRHDALAVIVDRYQRLVWSVAQKIVHDEGEAEDVVQIVFLELFQKMELFDPQRGTLKVWLLQLAYTRSINRRYHLQRRQFYNQVDLEEQEIAKFSPEESLLRLNAGETERLVRQLLDTLNPKQKVALELIAFNGVTFEELAARTGETVVNAKHHYYRGMMKLREYLSVPQQRSDLHKERRAQNWEIEDARAQSI
jgi:RNA polymerase sigma-70 factor, ECF subfamily